MTVRVFGFGACRRWLIPAPQAPRPQDLPCAPPFPRSYGLQAPRVSFRFWHSASPSVCISLAWLATTLHDTTSDMDCTCARLVYISFYCAALFGLRSYDWDITRERRLRCSLLLYCIVFVLLFFCVGLDYRSSFIGLLAYFCVVLPSPHCIHTYSRSRLLCNLNQSPAFVSLSPR